MFLQFFLIVPIIYMIYDEVHHHGNMGEEVGDVVLMLSTMRGSCWYISRVPAMFFGYDPL